jgi:hypothetical protein
MTNTTEILATFESALRAGVEASLEIGHYAATVGARRGIVGHAAMGEIGFGVGTVEVEWRVAGYRLENALTECATENGRPCVDVREAIERALAPHGGEVIFW